jgi:uncharacterized protein (TIGR00369 family)
MDDGYCFVCGEKNEKGMHLDFEMSSEGTARVDYIIPAYFQGYRHVIHGGIVATLLDEVMAKACLAAGLNAFTAEITVKFLKPVPAESPLRLEGHVKEKRHRLINTEGSLSVGKEICATAEAKFFVR